MGEKKRRLAGTRQVPGFDGRLIERAFHALRSGDRTGAQALFDLLEPVLPRDAQALHAGGVLALQLGHADRAEALLSRAAELDGRDPVLRSHLAIACRRLGDTGRAIEELEAALRLDASLPELHANLGTALLDRGSHAAANASFERALAIRPAFPDALNGRGNARLALGDADGACADFARAVDLEPRFHEAYYNLSRARTQRATSREVGAAADAPTSRAATSAQLALESILAALELHRDNDAYWTQLEVAVHGLDLAHPVDPRVIETLFRALGHPAVDPVRLLRPVMGLVASQPAALELRRLLPASGRFDVAGWLVAQRHAGAVLGAPLLQRLLEEVVVPHAFLQRLLGAVRGALLADWTADHAAAASLPLAAVAALAQQGFNTEYANDESADERKGVAALANAIGRARATPGAAPLHWLALYACYRPLHALDGAAAIAEDLAATPLARLAQRQVAQPLEERRIEATITAAAAPIDPASAAVRVQYEANPYPRWLRVRRVSAPMAVADFLRRLFPQANLDGVATGPASFLVAGCGTGRHSVESAQRFLASRMLALDLSRASLAYAMRKTRELGLENVDYRQADLTALGALDERFDVVECSGVLHHLRDPLSGWRTLLGLLEPGGMMRIGLYSEIARRHVARARELIAAEGFQPTPEGIRACRKAILARRDDDALLARVARGGDFYSMSGCRDLLFHVQETCFTLPQLARALADLDLAFIGFEFPDDTAAVAYRAQYPEDRALADLDNWHRFETGRPDTFAQMYQFWVRKRA